MKNKQEIPMEHIQKITETLSKDGDTAFGRAREVADIALEKGRETWKEMNAQGKEAISQAQKSAGEAWEDAQKLVQKHPGKAVGIALLVGAAVGALLAFRKND
jgi:ElaB/YqjD/DUF883 family membrane-anchored ribosome-binding protein